MAKGQPDNGRGRRHRRGAGPAAAPKRRVNYHSLRNPFTPQDIFSADRIAAIHRAALRVLQELGIKVLQPEARRLFAQAGASVDEDAQMVRIGADIVAAAIETAPKSFTLRGAVRDRDLVMEQGRLAFQSGAGAPNVTDLKRGRRPGTLADVIELTRIVQHFDAIQMLSPGVEPQDIPAPTRHYAYTRAQLTLSDKVPFVFSRGSGQVADCLEMLCRFRGLGADEFQSTPHCYTIINTNSPRQIDVPMARGLIDFARAGQLAIVTPFCLMGAMAPVTVAGAMTLSHAEALAAIALNQLARPGAPVMYGAFSSNVDMKSGAPAFGTPEQVKASLVAGQLARLLGLPWRNAAGCAANTNDAQAAHETEISAWGALLSGATVIIHAAGWIEGGLAVSYEKLITDMEMVQIMAELCAETPSDEAAIAFDALAEVPPGGHFFAAAHTLDRYSTAFYEPLVADWSNYGTWRERGGLDASDRATAIWERILEEQEPPASADPARVQELDVFIAKRTAKGGAPPES